MVSEFQTFAIDYRTALHHFASKPISRESSKAANVLGRGAIKLGLSATAFAVTHEKAMHGLVPKNATALIRTRIIKAARAFCLETLKVLKAGLKKPVAAATRFTGMIETLLHRSKELADSNQQLKAAISDGKSMEKTLRKREQDANVLLEKSESMRQELLLLSRDLLATQESDRKRMSRELQDVVAKALASIHERLENMKKNSKITTKQLHQNIGSALEILHQSVELVHRFAGELRPSILDDLGLIPALQAFLDSVSSDTPLKTQLKAYKELENISIEEKTAFYRVVQEAAANACKHAKATTFMVKISRSKGVISMDIHDNGTGFDVHGMRGQCCGQHLGMFAMRERIEMVGGTFCVESSPGNPTTLKITLPEAPDGTGNIRVNRSAETSLECV